MLENILLINLLKLFLQVAGYNLSPHCIFVYKESNKRGPLCILTELGWNRGKMVLKINK